MNQRSDISKAEVQDIVAAELTEAHAAGAIVLDEFLCDPYQRYACWRADKTEFFVVARLNGRVVYFDDIEEIFCVALDVEEGLSEPACFGPLTLALCEAKRYQSDRSPDNSLSQ